tara:strand:+ start:91 stop:558 length:468 start_codon:yes stop_codon:yes gene_type:complete
MLSQFCHQHQQCVDDALAKAQMICDDQKVSLTPLRKKVLKLIWEAGHSATKAYDLLESLKSDDPSAKPVTIYRALDFLLSNGLVHKIESHNSFIGCSHPTRQHNCAFLICNQCGSIQECCDDGAMMDTIKTNIDSTSFQIHNITLEIQGICLECS